MQKGLSALVEWGGSLSIKDQSQSQTRNKQVPTTRNTTLPQLPAGIRNPLPLVKAPKSLPTNFQQPPVRVNLPDRSAKLINLGGRGKNAK